MKMFTLSFRIGILICALGTLALTGCRGFRFSEPTPANIGDPTDAERQRAADRQAQQLGQKPTPVDYTRK